jgi:hypothetical protein
LSGIPAEVATWIEHYGQYAPDELLAVLRSEATVGAFPFPALGVEREVETAETRRGEGDHMPQGTNVVPTQTRVAPALATRSRPPLAKWKSRLPDGTLEHTPAPQAPPVNTVSSQLDPGVPVEQAKMQMSKAEAQALVARMRADERTRLYRVWCLPSEDRTHYAVVIDASLHQEAPRRQTITYSAAEWQQRMETMRTWRDLICPDAPGVPFAHYRARIQAKIEQTRAMAHTSTRKGIVP